LLRDEILAAADRIVAQNPGEESVSLRAIAREAGIAAPSMYAHFANKQEILRELLERDYADLAGRILSAVAQAPDDAGGLERAQAAAVAFSAFARDEPGKYRMMFEFRQGDAATRDLASHPVQHVVDALTDAVADAPAARSGRFEPRELAVALLSALHGQISLWRTLPTPPEVSYPGNRERIVLALLGAR
jgi:AcrR family transcriptional regulator